MSRTEADHTECPDTIARYNQLLKHRIWRLNNLYWIKNKEGKRIKFVMNNAQWELYNNLHTRNICLKARQRGFTTFIQLYCLDACLFIPNTNAGIVAHNLEDAGAFFKDKIKYAYDHLADHLKKAKPARNDSARELRFDNGSVIRVGTSLRSGTYQILHISEHGKLCAKFPDRAEEVKTGAIETVPKDGTIFIESTAEGRAGDFYDFCRKAMNHIGDLSSLDYKFHFFPWQDEYEYMLDTEVYLDDNMKKYFKNLESQGIVLNSGQKAWYVQKNAQLTTKMKREYPSTAEEAFEASITGAYFAKQMAQIRAKGQIMSVPIVPGVPILTFWDLGRDTTAIWFFQEVGFDYRFIDYFENSGEDMLYYVKMLKSRQNGNDFYLYGDCFLPHDGRTKSLSSEYSPAEILMNNGFDVRIVQRTKDKSLSIERARQVLPMCYFDKDRCQNNNDPELDGIAHLDNYRKEWDDKLGTWKPKPLHDKHSHGADAFMTFADGFYHAGEVEDHADEVAQTVGRNPTTGY